MTTKRRFVQVGLGGRHTLFRDAVAQTYAETCELMALCDNNPGRLRLSQDEVRQATGREVRGYAAEDFDAMIARERPDCVLVTPPDYLHDHYVCRAMELGCDVITEKPMTTDAAKCNRILETQRRTGKRCTVAFNYRYSPPLGLKAPGTRCHGCAEAAACPFHVSLAGNTNHKRLYLDCESHDGYFRDRCVFSPDIDIEDTMNLVVRYASRAIMNYSLTAFSPWEGYVVTLNGTRGRIEHKCEETVYLNGDGSVPGALKREGTWIRVYPHRNPAYEVKVWEAAGGHGGADPVMAAYLFAPDAQPVDRYRRAADQRAGAWSILTGVAANVAMAEGRPVRIDELVKGLEAPEYP